MARKNKVLGKLQHESKEATIAADERVKVLERQVSKLLENQDATVETDRRVLKLEAELRESRAKCKTLHEQLDTCDKRNATLVTLGTPARGKPPKKPARVKDSQATAVLVLSDWHVEEEVDPLKVNGLNSFDLAEAERRIRRTFEKALMLLEDARHLTDVNEMVVAVIGDLISGYIHEELEESNALAPLPAARFAQEHLAAGIDFLLAHGKLNRILIPTCYGNHGRTTKRMRFSTGDDNSYEQNLYYTLARQYRDEPRVQWKIEPGLHNWVDIHGRSVRFHHGDAIRYQGGVGGIAIPVNKAIAQWNRAKRADLDVFGHWHSFYWNWNWVSNGSLIGYAPFSLRIKADYQPPMQTFMVIDDKRGLTRAMPIFCT